MVFIDPVFHNTYKTCLNRITQSGYEWVEKGMCRFAEDMSWQTPCLYLPKFRIWTQLVCGFRSVKTVICNAKASLIQVKLRVVTFVITDFDCLFNLYTSAKLTLLKAVKCAANIIYVRSTCVMSLNMCWMFMPIPAYGEPGLFISPRPADKINTINDAIFTRALVCLFLVDGNCAICFEYSCPVGRCLHWKPFKHSKEMVNFHWQGGCITNEFIIALQFILLVNKPCFIKITVTGYP